jgi:hypothetical protein
MATKKPAELKDGDRINIAAEGDFADPLVMTVKTYTYPLYADGTVRVHTHELRPALLFTLDADIEVVAGP